MRLSCQLFVSEGTKLCHFMMLSSRTILLFCVALCILARPTRSCYRDTASNCPNYELVNQMSIIPIPDPDHLNTVCNQLQEGLQCVLSPTALGKCQDAVRAFYTSILNVARIPCLRLRSDYLSGRLCWKSSDLKDTMKICYMKHKDDANFCNGQREFVNCTITNILTVPHCGETEQRVLTAMVIRSYNENGLILTPPCPAMTTPPPRTTTTTTTKATTKSTSKITTTAAIVTTTSPTLNEISSTSSSDVVMTRRLESEPTTKSSDDTGVTRASRSAGDRLVPMVTVFGVALWMSVRLV